MKWKKIMAWAGGAIALFVLLVLCAAYLIQANTFLHRDLLATMTQVATKSSGAEITIRDYAVRWIPLRVTLKGVVVRGTEENPTKPLANLPQIEIGIAWRALLHKRVDLTELILDRPAVNFVVDQRGRSNLPAIPASTPSASKFQVSIDHAAVRNGELRYNDLPRKIDADLADFHADVSHDAGTDRYSGNLGYRKGRIAIEGYAPVNHDTQINFAANSEGIAFDRIQISTGLSHLNVKGVLRGYSNPVVEAQYEAALATAELRKQLQSVPLSGGVIDLAGSVSYRNAAGPPLNAIKLSGHISSKTLAVSLRGAEVSFHSFAGDYSLENGDLRVRGVQAESLGGILRAEFTGERLAATPRYQLSVSADSVSLVQAGQAAGTPELPLRGTAHLRASAHWISSVQNMIARADAVIVGSINSGQNSVNSPNGAWLPVNADVHAGYDAPHSTLTVTDSSFTSNQTSITASGTVSDHSTLSLRARAGDLHEVDVLLASAQNILGAAGKTSAAPVKPLELRGSASLEVQVRGRIQDPQVTGHVEANDLELRKTRWPHIQTDFDVAASSASVKNGQAQTSNRGRLSFVMTAGLQHWSYDPNNPVTAQVQASQIALSDLVELTDSSAPVSGTLSANLAVHGTINDPAGEGSIQLQNASFWGEPVRSVTTQIRGANKTISANFTIATAAGNISGNGEFGAADRHYQISIGHSVLNLAQIHYLSARGYAMAGTLGIDAQGQGTLQAPGINVALDGNQLAFRGTALGSMNADLHVANQQASFKLDSNIAGGQVHADGNAALAAPYMTEGAFEIRSLQFGPLLATYLPGTQHPFQGNAEVRGQFSGPLGRPEEVKASVELSTLNLAYQDFSLASAGPVRFNYADSV